MDSTYARAVAFAAPVFLVLIVLEAIVNWRRRTAWYSVPDSLTSVGCGMSSAAVRVLYGFAGLIVYQFVLSHWALLSLPAGHWGTWIFAFVFYDFCYYWWHRFSHSVAILWGAHIVHHQSEEFNLTTALRQPAGAPFTGWVFYLPLAFCGVPLGVYLVVGVIQWFYQFWPHTQHIGRLGFLDRWIQTPSNHRVHHARNKVYLDRNFVGVFLIWDRLFGTFEDERIDEPCLFGIDDGIRPWNPVWANLHYYWWLASDSWHTRRWTDKVRVWFASPGWRPADLIAQARPLPEPKRCRRKTSLSVYALVQFGLIAAANQHFLLVFPEQPAISNLLYFGFVLAGLVCVSGIAEVRREIFAFEYARLAAVPVVILSTRAWFGSHADPLVLVAIMAGAMASLIWFALISRNAEFTLKAAAPGRQSELSASYPDPLHHAAD